VGVNALDDIININRHFEPFLQPMRTVGHKSHDPCFHVFLMEAGVMTFVAHCTLSVAAKELATAVK